MYKKKPAGFIDSLTQRLLIKGNNENHAIPLPTAFVSSYQQASQPNGGKDTRENKHLKGKHLQMFIFSSAVTSE